MRIAVLPQVLYAPNAYFGDWWAGPEDDMAVDGAGHIYVLDTANHRVQIFNAGTDNGASGGQIWRTP